MSSTLLFEFNEISSTGFFQYNDDVINASYAKKY